MDKSKSKIQSSKSSKRRSTAIALAIRETKKRRLRPSSEPECSVSQPSSADQNMPSKNVDNTRKKRGPTQVKMVSENNYQKIELEFNEFGQVVGRNSEKFVTIAGALVREYVPVVIEAWPSVDEKKKLELWNFLQQRFNISDCHQKMTFQCMGTYWRTYKSRLRKQIKLQVPSAVNKKRTIGLLRPKNINCVEAWEKFVEDTLSNDFQKKSSKFANMRTNQKLLHTMGRKGYSRTTHDLKKKNPDIKGLRTRVWTHGHLRKDGKPINKAVAETLKKIEDCAKSISDTPAENSIRDDAVARILGPEHRGRVRGLGLGITPSKVSGHIQSNERVRELEGKLQTQSVRMEALEEKVEALLKLSQNQNKNVENMSSRAFTPQSLQGSGTNGGISPMENARCQLLHWYMFDEEEVVGEGKIASIDPTANVHHVPLGRYCWKVWVDEVYMSNLPLYRPTDELRVLSEAI